MTAPASSDLAAVAAQVGLNFDELDARIRDAGYLTLDEVESSRAALLRAFVDHCRSHSMHLSTEHHAEPLALAEDFARHPDALPTTAHPAAGPPQR